MRRAMDTLPNGSAPPWTSHWSGRLILGTVVVLCAALVYSAHAATPIYVTPDVPTREVLGGSDLLSWIGYMYDGVAYTPAFLVPGNPALADIHRMDKVANWL